MGRIVGPKYYRYLRMVSHSLEKCITIKERISQLVKEGWIILDRNDVVETNYVSSTTRELCTLHFGNLETIILLELELLNLNIQERSFPVTFLGRTTINMTSYSEVEEETDEDGGNKENCSGETDKNVAALEVMPIRLNQGSIFSWPNETRQHMVVALYHPKIYANRLKGVVEMS